MHDSSSCFTGRLCMYTTPGDSERCAGRRSDKAYLQLCSKLNLYVKQDLVLGGADIAQLVPAFVEHAIEARGVTRDERCTKLTVRCRLDLLYWQHDVFRVSV